MQPKRTTPKRLAPRGANEHPSARPVSFKRPAAARSSKPNARTRAELLDAIHSEHDRLEGRVASLTAEQLVRPGVVGEWSVKDILAHLTAWEARLLQRVQGEPEQGAALKTPAFNEQIYQAYRHHALDDVRSRFEDSYARVLAYAEKMTDDQASLWWAAFAFNTHGHYRWAYRLVRRWSKLA